MVDETLVKQARAIAAKHGYVSLVALAIGCTPAPSAQNVLMVTAEPSDATVVAPDASTVDASIVADEPPKGLSCLARTHAGTPKKAGDRWGLLLADGTFVPWEKRDGERTDASPFGLKDNYETRYAVGPIAPVTREDQNPGRVRVDELFFNTYGKTAREVQTSLVTVMVGGKAFAVHTKIAAPLRRVAVHVADAMKKDPKLERFFASPGGTFNWRFRPRASSGEGAGTTSTRCTSSTARSSWTRAAICNRLSFNVTRVRSTARRRVGIVRALLGRSGRVGSDRRRFRGRRFDVDR